MKTHEKYRDTKNARYALKHIKEEYYEDHDPESYILAAWYVVLFVPASG